MPSFQRTTPCQPPEPPLLQVVRLGLLVSLLAAVIEIVALPRERAGSRPIELTAGMRNVEEELDYEPSAGGCEMSVRPELPALAQVPAFRVEDWLPKVVIEFPQIDGPANMPASSTFCELSIP